MRSFVAGAGLLSLVLLAGCTVGPDFKRPRVAVPEKWQETPQATDNASRADLARWWTTFDDPVLTSLVDEAIGSNLDLQMAAARVREARSVLGVTEADRWPGVDASAAQTRSRTSEKSPRSGRGGVTGGREYDQYQAGFDASWEIDIWGGVRRAVEAAGADIDASMEARRSVLVTLLGDVARGYIEVRGTQKRIAITKDNIRIQKDALELVRVRYEAGLNSYLEVSRAGALVASTESELPELERSLKESVHRLGVLVGKEPGALYDRLAKEAPIPQPVSNIPAGLPSELLLRRPDIRQAERELAAATARIGVATADLFPRFSLTGTFGLEGGEARDLGFSSSRFWNIGPAIRWPLFDAGRIRANMGVQDAKEEQALIRYRQVVLTALEDVENALVTHSREKERMAALAKAVDADRQSSAMAIELYTKGLANFLDVLEAEKSRFSSESRLVESETAAASSLVALYKALGGGWEVEETR